MKIENVITGNNLSFPIKYEVRPFSKPCVVFFHPDVSLGGDMNNLTIKTLFDLFSLYDFSVVRMNFSEIKQINKKQKPNITPHIKIANASIQWFKNKHMYTGNFWVVGVDYGCRIAMQMLMRNPEVSHAILIDPYIHFADINHIPLDNIVVSMFYGENDPVLQNNYLSTLVRFLREKKQLFVNTVGIKDTGPLSTPENTPLLKNILENYLSYF